MVRGNLELLEHLVTDFIKQQAQQHIVYTEMRYSPHLLAHGATLDPHQQEDKVNANSSVNAITCGL